MYGIVNQALGDFIERRFGTAMWNAVRADVGSDAATFNGLQQYPDDVTSRLTEATSRRAGISQDVLMEAFGVHWIQYTANKGYGDLFKMAGSDLVSFLKNLDALHARVGRSYPALSPPSFQCDQVQEGRLLLHYYSRRDGLTEFVVGLIKGLGGMFDVPVRVEVVERKSAGADHDVFRVDYEPRD